MKKIIKKIHGYISTFLIKIGVISVLISLASLSLNVYFLSKFPNNILVLISLGLNFICAWALAMWKFGDYMNIRVRGYEKAERRSKREWKEIGFETAVVVAPFALIFLVVAIITVLI